MSFSLYVTKVFPLSLFIVRFNDTQIANDDSLIALFFFSNHERNICNQRFLNDESGLYTYRINENSIMIRQFISFVSFEFLDF